MMHDSPYLAIVGRRIQMAGKDGPKDTIFGVLGHERETNRAKSLGGLKITKSKSEMKVPTLKDSKMKGENTERHIIGHSKTHIPGVHYGMIPYPGVYMSHTGKEL